MPDVLSKIVPMSYSGPMPAAPVAPAAAPAAYGGAVALGLDLGTVYIMIAGDIRITGATQGVTVERR